MELYSARAIETEFTFNDNSVFTEHVNMKQQQKE